jgi:hypothetical protein
MLWLAEDLSLAEKFCNESICLVTVKKNFVKSCEGRVGWRGRRSAANLVVVNSTCMEIGDDDKVKADEGEELKLVTKR